MANCPAFGCDEPIAYKAEYCVSHARILYNFRRWLYGPAVKRFDLDVIELIAAGD